MHFTFSCTLNDSISLASGAACPGPAVGALSAGGAAFPAGGGAFPAAAAAAAAGPPASTGGAVDSPDLTVSGPLPMDVKMASSLARALSRLGVAMLGFCEVGQCWLRDRVQPNDAQTPIPEPISSPKVVAEGRLSTFHKL